MFGRGWEPAEATIVALKEIRSIGNVGPEGESVKAKTFDYVADIQPSSGGSVFRTVMHEPFDERHWRQPSIGDVVLAICDPKRQKAKFDTATATAQDKAQKEAKKNEDAARFDAMVNAAPGSSASPPGQSAAEPRVAAQTSSASGALSTLQAHLSETTADALGTANRLSAATADLAETMAAIKRARAAGDVAEVERLKSEFTTRAGQNVAAARQSAADSTAKAAASDPLERLQKLADLHDRGVLTDAEFAAEKAKILSEP